MHSSKPSPRTIPTRRADRMSHDPTLVHAILDEAFVCHVATVVDGEPRVLPMLQVRLDDTLYLHTSTGARLALAARDGGVPVCVASTSMLSGNAMSRSTNDRVASIVPRIAWNSGMLVVKSRVTSITGALSGPYASTLKVAMIGA